MVKIVYEGAVDSIVARAVPPPISRQFERAYLCPKCGQEGAVDHYKLSLGGTVTCPVCGATMNETNGGR